MPVGLPSSGGLSDTVGKVVVKVSGFIDYLQLPSRSEYWEALQQAGHDVIVAVTSVNQLTLLTFRPLLLFVWFLLQKIYIVAKFLFRHLFQGLYISTLKGLQQLHWITRKIITWQSRLTRTQLLLEAGIILVLVALYLLRRHIQKQGYVEKVTRWYRIKERRAVKFYRLQLDRISRTSIFLAMILPHALFVGVCLFVKLLFPRFITYLARETYLIFGLSVLYPWIWTISLLFQYRHPDAIKGTEQQTPIDSKIPSSSRRRTPLKEQTIGQSASGSTSTSTSSSASGANRKFTDRKIRTSTTYPRSTPKTPEQQEQPVATSAPAKTPVQRLLEANKRTGDYSVQEEAKYWLEYWLIYSLFTAFCRVVSLIPIVGRIASRSTWISTLSLELQLCFYLWIYGLGSVLTSTASSDADLQRSYLVRPLPFMVKRVSPLVQQTYKKISEDLIPPQMWTNLVEKVKSFLSVAVMVRLLSEKSKDRLLQCLEYAHPFMAPGVTLFMPGFVTEYGVLYVNTVVPANKAFRSKSLSQTMNSLQYWVLQALLGGILQWLSGLLWWIPFSTHVIFILWCNLQYSSDSWYNTLETELQAFGLLPRTSEEVLSVDKTVTATVLRRIASSLPSASDNDNRKDDEGSVEKPDKSEEKTVSEGEPSKLEGDEKVVPEAVTQVVPETVTQKADSEPDILNGSENDEDNLNLDENVQATGCEPKPLRRSTRARTPRIPVN